MIVPKVVAEIQRLLSETRFSQRKIARLTGVSRNTVGAIALGRHRNGDLPEEPCGGEPEEPVGPPRRCPGCGGLVTMPCLLCLARKERLGRTPRTAGATFLVSPALDLRPEHRARYEEVRRARQAADYEHHDTVGLRA